MPRDNDRRQALSVTGTALTDRDVAGVARLGWRVDVGEEARGRIDAGRRVVEAAVADGAPLYGVTHGLGNRADESLPEQALADFSIATIRGRATAVGAPLPADVVRAAMLIRLNTVCTGRSGASRAVAGMLADVLNAGLLPEMPEFGSIGSSDLCVMAHLGLALIGEGTFLEEGGGGPVRRPAAEVLARHGLAPLVPGPKDGLVLCSNSAHTAARGVLAMVDARRALETAQTTAVMSMEGFRGNPSPLDPRAAAARPQPGQERAAAGLRQRLAGSRLFETVGPRRLQDPLSLRCTAPVHGAAYASLEFLWSALDPEINGSGDNPLVLAEDRTAISTGNFQLPLLTVALDAAGQSLAHVAVAAAGRCARLLSGTQAGLPENLSPRWPDGSGFAPLMKTVEALLTDIRHESAATPAALSAGPDGVEDTIANAPFAAAKLQRLVEQLERLLAVEAMVAAQAVDLAAVVDVLPAAVARAHEAVRNRVPALDHDRPLGGEVQRVADELVRGGVLAGVVGE